MENLHPSTDGTSTYGPPERLDVIELNDPELNDGKSRLVRVHPGPLAVQLTQAPEGHWKIQCVLALVRGVGFTPEDAKAAVEFVRSRRSEVFPHEDGRVTTRCPTCRKILLVPSTPSEVQCGVFQHTVKFDDGAEITLRPGFVDVGMVK